MRSTAWMVSPSNARASPSRDFGALTFGTTATAASDGSGGVVATEERIGQPARLSHFDLGTGKEAQGGVFPQGTLSLLTSGRVLFQGSEVAVLPQFTSTYGTAATLAFALRSIGSQMSTPTRRFLRA